jgi:hypothetical protein
VAAPCGDLADRILSGSIQREPTSEDVLIQDRLRFVYGIPAGIELGAWDHRCIDWLACNFDTPSSSPSSA